MELHAMCPRRWYARYLLGFRDPPQIRGIDFHAEVAEYLRGQLPVEKLSPVVRKGLEFLPSPNASIRIEQSIDGFRLADIPMVGNIDLIDLVPAQRPDRPIDPSGTIEILDHKFRDTLKNAPGVTKLLLGIQMPLYALWAETQWAFSYLRLSHLTFSVDPKEGIEKNPTTLVNSAHLRIFREGLTNLVERIKGDASATRASEVLAKPGRRTCKAFGRLCPYAAQCSACLSELKPPQEKKPMTLSEDELALFDETPVPKIVIQDETAKPIPAGRAEQGRLYRMPDKTLRRFLCQTGGKMSFITKTGEAPTLLPPDTLIEPISELPASYEAAKLKLTSIVPKPIDGHQTVLPPDAPKSEMVPGMAFAAEDGTVSTDKKKRGRPAKAKVPTAVKMLEELQTSAAATAADSEDEHAGCLTQADEKLKAVIETMESPSKISTDEDVRDVFLATAGAFVQELAKVLSGKKIVVTIELP